MALCKYFVMKWMTKVVLLACCLLLSLSRALRDDRACREKVEGPLVLVNGSYETRNVLHVVADEDGLVTFQCRMTCTDPDGWYTPLLKVVTTEDGKSHQSTEEAGDMYKFNFTRNDILFEGCTPNTQPVVANNVTDDYVFTISIIITSPSVNRSIAMCGVQYRPADITQSGDLCFSSGLVWITTSPAPGKDDRPCNEKLEGPLDEDNLTPEIVHLTADENNSVIVRCRVTCQDPNGEYNPFVKIVNAENGRHFEFNDTNDSNDLYELTPLTSTRCNFEENVTQFEYMYQITAKNESVNRSIVMCGLHYVPGGCFNEEVCYSSNVAWIVLATTLPIATTPNKNTDPSPTADSVKIPYEAASSSIGILTLAVIVLGVAVVILTYLLIKQKGCSGNIRVKGVETHKETTVIPNTGSVSGVGKETKQLAIREDMQTMPGQVEH